MTEADLLIHNAQIVAFDEAGTEIRDGSIAVVGNSIAWLGPASESAARFTAKQTIDARGMIAMPVIVGSEVASRLRGTPRPPKLLCGLLEDTTWAITPQRGGRSPTAEGVLGDAGWSGWGGDVGQVSDGGWGWRLGPKLPRKSRFRWWAK